MLIFLGIILVIATLAVLGGIALLYKISSTQVSPQNAQNRLAPTQPNRDVYDSQLINMRSAGTQMEDSLLANPDLQANIQGLLNYYEPGRGVFTSWWQRNRAEGRFKLQEVLNQEQNAYLESLMTLERQVREGKKQQVEYELFIAQNATILFELKNRAALADAALGSGMNVEHFSESNKEKESVNARVEEYGRKTEIDKQHEAWKIEQNLSAAFRVRQVEDSDLARLRDELEKAIDKKEEIELMEISEYSKLEKLAIVESTIANLKFRIKAKEKRLEEDAH